MAQSVIHILGKQWFTVHKHLYCLKAESMSQPSQPSLCMNPSFFHLHLTTFEILGKVFKPSKLHFLLCKMKIILRSIS